MFDIGWSELLIIGIVALIVVGPKDLPGMFRTLGRLTGKMRGMAREFQRAMNQAAEESGAKDIAKEIKLASSPTRFGLDTVRSAAKEFQDGLISGDSVPSKTAAKVSAKASAGVESQSEAFSSGDDGFQAGQEDGLPDDIADGGLTEAETTNEAEKANAQSESPEEPELAATPADVTKRTDERTAPVEEHAVPGKGANESATAGKTVSGGAGSVT